MSATVIYLIRHGETAWNSEGRFQGRLNSPLTSRGVAQAEACGRRLAQVAGVVDAMSASPLGRVRETVAIIRSYAPYPDVYWDHRLEEVSIGAWDGLTHVDIDACWPGSLNGSTPYDWFFRSPDGERFDAAAERVSAWLGGLTGTVVAVSHGLLGRIIRGTYLGIGMEEALRLPVSQDVIWRLAEGRVEAVRT